MRSTCQMGGLKGKKFLNMLKGYSKAVIYRHCKKPLDGQLKDNKRVDSGVEGLSKLCRLDHRNKKRHYQLRETEGLFTSKRVQVETRLQYVSCRTVRGAINKKSYKYLRKSCE